jgi:hypothetical protein
MLHSRRARLLSRSIAVAGMISSIRSAPVPMQITIDDPLAGVALRESCRKGGMCDETVRPETGLFPVTWRDVLRIRLYADLGRTLICALIVATERDYLILCRHDLSNFLLPSLDCRTSPTSYSASLDVARKRCVHAQTYLIASCPASVKHLVGGHCWLRVERHSQRTSRRVITGPSQTTRWGIIQRNL